MASNLNIELLYPPPATVPFWNGFTLKGAMARQKKSGMTRGGETAEMTSILDSRQKHSEMTVARSGASFTSV